MLDVVVVVVVPLLLMELESTKDKLSTLDIGDNEGLNRLIAFCLNKTLVRNNQSLCGVNLAARLLGMRCMCVYKNWWQNNINTICVAKLKQSLNRNEIILISLYINFLNKIFGCQII